MKLLQLTVAALCFVICSFTAHAKEDIVVPTPNPLDDTASLTVAGDAGSAWLGYAQIFSCETDAQKNIKQGGCRYIVDLDLNREEYFTPGFYTIAVGNSWVSMELVKGQKHTLQLEKLMPASPITYPYAAFLDFNDVAMQDKFVASYWNSEYFAKKANSACSNPRRTALATKLCNAWQSGDIAKFKSEAFTFTADAKYSMIWVDANLQVIQTNEDRYYMNSHSTNPYVGVLQGTYGMSFIMRGNQDKAVYGIVVK